MNSDTEKLGKSIFNLQRFQILQTKLNPSTSDCVPNAYAYAWYEKVFPILHNDELHEDLEKYFSVSREQINIISKRADKEWIEHRTYSFYEYEEYFQSRSSPVNGIDRITLIHSFRYMYLNGAFDKDFWAKLLEPMNHPAEASSITRKFDIEDIYLI